MKLSDFTLKVVKADAVGEREKFWKQGSRCRLIGTGTIGDKKYQVKIHAGEPAWHNTADQIRRKKDELKSVPADDDDKKEQIKAEIQSLERNKDRWDKEDALYDKFVECRQKIIRTIASTHDPLIVGPADCWKQPISFRGDGTSAVEATPWLENVAVGFTKDDPIVFNRDLSDSEQREIVATLADRLAKLHAVGVVHGDLKVGNTLITKEGGKLQAALIDFDASMSLKELQSGEYGMPVWYYLVGGTYFSPEHYLLYDAIQEDDEETFDMQKAKISPKSDIFSLAFTIYEYYYGAVDNAANLMPFVSPEGEKLTTNDYSRMIVQMDYKPAFPDDMPDFLYGMLHWMLCVDPDKRPTAEQVRDAFRSGDASAIPSEFTRNPLHPEHRDTYEATLPDGVSLLPAAGLRYRRVKNGISVNRTIEQLLSEHLVAYKGDAPKPADAPDPDAGKAWDRDGGGALPACARRATKEGKYFVLLGGISKTADYDDLKRDGIICTPEEAKTPWPCDDKLRFAPGKQIARNFAAGKGPGYYVVSDGPFKTLCSAEELVRRGYAAKGVTFNLWRDDAETYEVSPDTIPSNVEGVVRYTVRNHYYTVQYAGGERKQYSVEQMEAQGFVRKK